MGMSSKQVSSDHLELNWTQNMLTTSETTTTTILTTTILQSSSNPHSTNTKRSLLHTQQQQPDTLKCPRCDSSNTKFCYYNNYNKTQPRHYCKACKRHWTKGGTLRNVPVGGGRKIKRIKRPANNVNNTATIDHNNLELFGDHQKYIFPQDNINKGFLFKQPINGTTTSSEFDQVSWDFNGGFATSMQQQQQNLGFSIHSSLTSMDTNTTIIPTSSYSPLLLSGFKDDSTITTTSRMMTPNSSNNVVSTQPWMMQAPTPISNILEPNNFWTWNDIDYMVQGDHNINKPFDEGPHTMKH